MSISKPDAPDEDGARLDLERYVPFYLGTISNRWTASLSQLSLRRFGIGIVDWRILGFLGSRNPAGNSTSIEIAATLSIDRAAVSRAMRNLVAKGLVEPVAGRFAGSTKPFRMTRSGRALFKQMLTITSDREDYLLGDLTADERAQLILLLRKLHQRLPGL